MKSFLHLLLLLGLISVAAANAAETKQPNILFLFSDDQCYETIRAFGHTDIDTPNLDRLAARGTVFPYAYNMGSFSPAVCVASRTMLITGRSLWRAQAIYHETDQERQAGRLWPQLMSRAGYTTYFTGKWHIRADAAKAFDIVKNIRPGMPKDVKEGYNRPLEGETDPWSPSDPKFGGFWEGGKHWSEVTADDAIEFLGHAKEKKGPFFMYVAFNAPHDPRQAPREYIDRYPLARIQLPKSFLPEYPHHREIGCGPGLRDERLAPFPRTEQAVKLHRQEYYAMITHLDAQIGRILDALEQTGQAENTWIFFTSDHGLAVGHHGLLGKQNLYEHSLRVPLIVAGPGAPQGKQIDAAVQLQDIMPTTLVLAGAAKPERIEFHSLLPLLQGETTKSAYPAIYGAYLDLQRSVTHEGYKLILYPKARVARLYHLPEDPLERNDLAADPKHAGTKRQLFQRLIELQEELADALDLKALGSDLDI
jgi:arylsulfatase A-like enzyme